MKFEAYFSIQSVRKCKFVGLKELGCNLYYFLLPVPITEFIKWILWVLVIWMPSVLGLFSGADTMRPEALTSWHLLKERSICWPSLMLRSFTIRFLQDLKVRACRNWTKDETTSVPSISFLLNFWAW